MKRTLFKNRNDFLRINIEIHFTEDSKIIVSGYDSGKIVQEIKGSSDYEYFITIEPDDVKQLNTTVFNKNALKGELLLDWFEKKFNNDKAISLIKEKLTALEIKFKFSTW